MVYCQLCQIYANLLPSEVIIKLFSLIQNTLFIIKQAETWLVTECFEDANVCATYKMQFNTALASIIFII